MGPRNVNRKLPIFISATGTTPNFTISKCFATTSNGVSDMTAYLEQACKSVGGTFNATTKACTVSNPTCANLDPQACFNQQASQINSQANQINTQTSQITTLNNTVATLSQTVKQLQQQIQGPAPAPAQVPAPTPGPVTPAKCLNTPWGTVNSGFSGTAYQTTIPSGACVSETKTCNAGNLSGSYTFTVCTSGCPATPVTWSSQGKTCGGSAPSGTSGQTTIIGEKRFIGGMIDPSIEYAELVCKNGAWQLVGSVCPFD